VCIHVVILYHDEVAHACKSCEPCAAIPVEVIINVLNSLLESANLSGVGAFKQLIVMYCLSF